MFVKELRELLELLGRIAKALEYLADDSLAARNARQQREAQLYDRKPEVTERRP